MGIIRIAWMCKSGDYGTMSFRFYCFIRYVHGCASLSHLSGLDSNLH